MQDNGGGVSRRIFGLLLQMFFIEVLVVFVFGKKAKKKLNKIFCSVFDFVFLVTRPLRITFLSISIKLCVGQG